MKVCRLFLKAESPTQYLETQSQVQLPVHLPTSLARAVRPTSATPGRSKHSVPIAIPVLSLCYPIVIPLLSHCYPCVIPVLSLCYPYVIPVQPMPHANKSLKQLPSSTCLLRSWGFYKLAYTLPASLQTCQALASQKLYVIRATLRACGCVRGAQHSGNSVSK